MYTKTESEIDLINFLQTECPEFHCAVYRVIKLDNGSKTMEDLYQQDVCPNLEYYIRLESDIVLLTRRGDHSEYTDFFNGHYVSECPVGSDTVSQETITNKDAFESLKDYIKDLYDESE